MEHRHEHMKEEISWQTGAAILNDKTTGSNCNARLNYMSCHGMYFEADDAFKPGNIIDLQFDSPPLYGASKSYRATVYWCMILSEDESISKFGVGVKYFQSSEL